VSSSSNAPPAPAPLHLYVHCGTSVEYLTELNASIPGVQQYAERALLLAERGDIVCVADEVEPDYLAYLAEIGVGPAAGNVLVASRFEGSVATDPLWRQLLTSPEALEALGCLIQRKGSAQVHPFIATPGQFELAAALQLRSGMPVLVNGGDPGAVAYADFKHHIRAKAIELGIPVAPGEVVDLGSPSGGHHHAQAALRQAVERQIQLTGRVIVRGTSGAAGSATFAVERSDQIADLAHRLASRTENRIYLVEAMVDMTVSPNVQMHVDRDVRAIRCAGMTDQRWERPLVHGGNLYPSCAARRNDMLRWSRQLAEWLHSVGFAGLAGFDYVEYIDASAQPQAFLAELNPRVNGATYPLQLRRRLNVSQREAGFPEIQAFTSGTIRTEARTFVELREMWDDRLFCRETGTGLIPYVPGLLRFGKCGVVAVATSREQADELYDEAGAISQAV
jgi:hypothetical protein